MTTATDEKPIDPWAELPHPVRQWRPGARSIRQPLPLGQYMTGEPADLVMWDAKHGAHHLLLGGSSGAGKTNTINCLMCGLASCDDVVIWYIDVAKAGQGAAAWGPCVDWLATTRVEAVKMMRAAVRVIETRARKVASAEARGKGTGKVRPSPRAPYLVIVIDEASGAMGVTQGRESELAAQMSELALLVAQTGRSMGVSLVVATQRPTVPSLGVCGGDIRAQLDRRIGLRMNKRPDIRFVLDGDLDDIDTSVFNQAGVLLLQTGPDADPLPLRSYALYLPGAVARLAAIYGQYRVPLDAVSAAAAGPDYAGRDTDPFRLRGDQGDDVDQGEAGQLWVPPTARTTEPPKPAPAVDEQPAPITNAVDRVAAAVKAARAAAAIELDEVPAVPIAQLAVDDEQQLPDEPDDAENRARALAAITSAGEQGLRARDLIALDICHRSTVYRVLRRLRDAGEVHQVRHDGKDGNGRGYRYYAVGRPTTQDEQRAA